MCIFWAPQQHVVLLLQAGQFKYNADDAKEEAVSNLFVLLASQWMPAV